MVSLRYSILICLCALAINCFAQTAKPAFRLVPLGVLGGGDESNLSSYMLAPVGSNSYICLDAGTLRYGIERAVANKVFNKNAEQVLKQNIKAYLISHGHLDHLAGMVINAPDDTTKNIYALGSTIETLKTKYFTWQSWANFADEGEAPALKKYHYKVVDPGNEVAIENTELAVRAFPLAHANLTSTAFLVRSGENYLLYLGDVGPDAIEKSDKLHQLWEAVAPLIRSKKLKAIMIEVSFPNEQPDKTLFGHLTPKWLMAEMGELSKMSGSLKGLNVVVTHLKPPASSINKIKGQLKANNAIGVNLIFPQQSKALTF
ncbi:3',5'-cyclic-nucleotide phosphodiesterase [Mucilaginibacter pallidiroseus]|uniref:3',5'-cyclic-nucleotide phosphodiesterase n=1 Tax=Mucilaginibacter pallidiroseus TaxID=2599295 RepID=A0A563UDH1_9SPHI|nr:3',5'-cyclic-nucleotide phosphodiesterase [Mucilaginibacter pallidiroseus]TWR29333.1 3',5'-cyclic-nucleotide phosphodiesterase [Mucilaginibacter pallidiroseus]